MSGIFISYRREDTRPYARSLTDTLVARFGSDQIFRDVDSLAPGADFPDAIADAVGRCDVLLALIGKQWISATLQGRRRLDDPNDYVRLEIAAALGRDTIVVPVLIEDAQMPRRDELPEALAELADRNALRLTDESWNDGVRRLFEFLEPVVGRRPPPPPPPSSASPPAARPLHGPPPGQAPGPPGAVPPAAHPPAAPGRRGGRGRAVLIGVLSALATIVLLALLLPGNDTDPPDEPAVDTSEGADSSGRLGGEVDARLSSSRPCCTYAVQVRIFGFGGDVCTLRTIAMNPSTGDTVEVDRTEFQPESDDDQAGGEVDVLFDEPGTFVVRFVLEDPDGTELDRFEITQRVDP